MTVAAVVTAAGQGIRLGSDQPKALVPIGGVAMVAWAVRHIADAVDRIVVTAPAGHRAQVEASLAEVSTSLPASAITVIDGGGERQQSVSLAVDALFADGSEPEVVLVHDAARPFQPVAVAHAAIAAVRAGAGGAIPVVPVVDTIVTVPADSAASLSALSAGSMSEITDYLRRDVLRAVQTPQAFAGSLLRRAHLDHSGSAATDDAQLVRAAGHSVVTVDGHEWGFKVTVPADLDRAERICAMVAEAAVPLERAR